MSDKESRRALLRVYDILECIKKIESYLRGYDLNKFQNDFLVQDAVVRNIEVIGEAAKNISMEICALYPEISWRDMKAMRDVIAHGYFNIKPDIVWRVAAMELPPLKEPLEKLFRDLERKESTR